MLEQMQTPLERLGGQGYSRLLERLGQGTQMFGSMREIQDAHSISIKLCSQSAPSVTAQTSLV